MPGHGELAAVRQRSERARSDSERAQQEAASKIAQQLEQAMARAQTLVAEAKTKAERIREDSERDLTAAIQRRDSVNAQLANVHRELAALGVATTISPMRPTEPAVDQDEAGDEAEQ